MTDKEYKVVVKLLIEELEKCRDEIFEQQKEIERLKAIGCRKSFVDKIENMVKEMVGEQNG